MRERVQQVMVMYGGQCVEHADTETLFAHPAHPYTRGLFAARPRLDWPRGTRLSTIAGQVPELHDLPAGCAFAGRCPQAQVDCAGQAPRLDTLAPAHQVRCPHWSVA
jgi:peptide/nickel transport system ATP-binding protein